ncbi:MAG: hypothetical protein NWR39_02065, partial [Pseudomonadota bacterium]|nr:hypothetical protein [Pseudomonadota bacterium]
TEGLVVATVVIDNVGQILQTPQLTFKGLCDSDAETEALSREIYLSLRETLVRGYKSNDDRLETLKAVIRKAAHRYLMKKPVVDVHIIMAEM